MDMSGWNLNWQGFSQNPTVYQNGTGHPDVPGYLNGDPPLADASEDEQMGGMADSLATLRPEPEPDLTLESTIPGHMPYDGVQYPTTVSVVCTFVPLPRRDRMSFHKELILNERELT